MGDFLQRATKALAVQAGGGKRVHSRKQVHPPRLFSAHSPRAKNTLERFRKQVTSPAPLFGGLRKKTEMKPAQKEGVLLVFGHAPFSQLSSDSKEPPHGCFSLSGECAGLTTAQRALDSAGTNTMPGPRLKLWLRTACDSANMRGCAQASICVFVVAFSFLGPPFSGLNLPHAPPPPPPPFASDLPSTSRSRVFDRGAEFGVLGALHELRAGTSGPRLALAERDHPGLPIFGPGPPDLRG